MILDNFFDENIKYISYLNKGKGFTFSIIDNSTTDFIFKCIESESIKILLIRRISAGVYKIIMKEGFENNLNDENIFEYLEGSIEYQIMNEKPIKMIFNDI